MIELSDLGMSGLWCVCLSLPEPGELVIQDDPAFFSLHADISKHSRDTGQGPGDTLWVRT